MGARPTQVRARLGPHSAGFSRQDTASSAPVASLPTAHSSRHPRSLLGFKRSLGPRRQLVVLVPRLFPLSSRRHSRCRRASRRRQTSAVHPFPPLPPGLPQPTQPKQEFTSLRPVALVSFFDGIGVAAQAVATLQVKPVLYFSFEVDPACQRCCTSQHATVEHQGDALSADPGRLAEILKARCPADTLLLVCAAPVSRLQFDSGLQFARCGRPRGR